MNKKLLTKTAIIGLFASALAFNASAADVSSDDGLLNSVFGVKTTLGANSPWYFGGHAEAGWFYNQHGSVDKYSGGELRPDSGNSGTLLNTRSSDIQLNQLYLYFGKALDSSKTFDIGGRVDVMFGTDATYAQSYGLEKKYNRHSWHQRNYYTALPQFYVEAGWKTLNAKFGKFLAPFGHESILSTDHFFYSLAPSTGMLPATQTGLLVTWTPLDRLSVFGGWTTGQRDLLNNGYSDGDTFFENGNNNAVIVGAKYDLNEAVTLKYTGMFGLDNNYGPDGWGRGDRKYYVHAFNVDAKLTEKWRYSLEWVLRNERDQLGDSAHWGGYSLNNEVVYQLDSQWSFGGRFNWSRNYHSYSGIGYSVADHQNLYSVSVGANWKPFSWLTVRPEVRYDKVTGDDKIFKGYSANDASKHQVSFGLSAVVKF